MTKQNLRVRDVVRWLAPGLLFLCVVCPSLANDGFFAGSGSNLYPLENLDVRLVREVVTFDQVDAEEHVFAVSALLFFRNETADTVKGKVGFPKGAANIQDLTVYVDGTRVDKVRYGTYQTADGTPSNRNVYLFNMAFPPGELTTILHKYLLEASWYNDGSSHLPYNLETGGMWRGTIEEAVFQYRFSRPPVCLALSIAGRRLAGWDWTSRATGRRGEWTTQPLDEAETGLNYSFDYVAGPRPAFTI